MKLPSALEIANLLVLLAFRLHGIPQDIVSDQVPSSPLRCEKLSALVRLSSGYHPIRTNQDLESSLRCVASRLPASWSSHLPWIEYAPNPLVSSVTGMLPFMVMCGFQPPLFPSQESEVAVPWSDNPLLTNAWLTDAAP